MNPIKVYTTVSPESCISELAHRADIVLERRHSSNGRHPMIWVEKNRIGRHYLFVPTSVWQIQGRFFLHSWFHDPSTTDPIAFEMIGKRNCRHCIGTGTQNCKTVCPECEFGITPIAPPEAVPSTDLEEYLKSLR